MAPEMHLDVFIIDDYGKPKEVQKQETPREVQEELIPFF
jgi:hypothetical protein